MKKATHFVYYDDDHADAGGIGLRAFQNAEAACRFIDDRIRKDPERYHCRELSDYTLIAGKKLNMQVVEVINKVCVAV